MGILVLNLELRRILSLNDKLHKVLNFIKNCLQYSQYPTVLNLKSFMKCFPKSSVHTTESQGKH